MNTFYKSLVHIIEPINKTQTCEKMNDFLQYSSISKSYTFQAFVESAPLSLRLPKLGHVQNAKFESTCQNIRD